MIHLNRVQQLNRLLLLRHMKKEKLQETAHIFVMGYEVVGGFTIRCHDVSGHGTITTKQALAYSCNDALMRIGFDLGAKKLVEYQRRFGFGAENRYRFTK